MPAGRRQKPEDQSREGRFAATGFANDAEHVTGPEIEGHAIDRSDDAFRGGHAGACVEGAADVADLDGEGHTASVCGQSGGRRQRY